MLRNSVSISILIFLVALYISSCLPGHEVNDYRGYKVYRIKTENETDINVLKIFEKNHPEVDFWTSIQSPTKYTDVMIPQSYFLDLQSMLKEANILFAETIPDVKKLVDSQRESQQFGKMRLRHDGVIYESFNFDRFPRFDQVEAWIDFLLQEYPELLEIIEIGKSYEGRIMKVLKVGKKTKSFKPAIWIDAGIHAREWITVTTILYFLSQLVEPKRWSNDTLLHDLSNEYLDKLDFYILPIHNPDGYEYTHTAERLWRKTRSTNKRSTCIGADANRNWGHSSWGATGASDNPCSQVYQGETKFSEIENENVKNFLISHRDSIFSFMSIHSYSQLWLLPYGHGSQHPKDYDELYAVGLNASLALESVHGTKYQVGSITDLLYFASGSSLDWAYDNLKVKYSYGLELRDRGEYGFLLPVNEILPVGQETWDGYKVVINKIIEEYGFLTKGKD
ncbi:unnamed protein product [Gordionus sp. m RMFG-2023]|uniref:carboxypeptidase B-like n=1 Tax=Gordionus sp. m RMFG-2023 TaxID=3053472 RepID=UPI0030DEA25B